MSDAKGSSEAKRRPDRAVNPRWVLLGLLVSMLLAAVGAVVIYDRFVHYERVAARHLPANTSLAIRVDLEKVVLYEPFREHLLPLFEAGAPAGAARSRLDRLQSATRLELAVDIREIVLGYVDDPSAWVIVLAGKFPRSGVVAGLERVLAEEGVTWSRNGDVLTVPSGVSIGQANDGAVVIAATSAIVREALPPTATHERLGLPTEGAGGFALSPRLIEGWSHQAPTLVALRPVQGVTGRFRLEQDVWVTAHVTLQPGTGAKQHLPELERLRAALAHLALQPKPRDRARAGAVLARAELAVEGANTVRVQAQWTRDDVDRAAAALSAFARRVLDLPGTASARVVGRSGPG